MDTNSNERSSQRVCLGNTPLHEASFLGRDDAVKALIKAGANWKFVNKLGWTSLHVGERRSSLLPSHSFVSFQQAALGNCPTIVELLVTRSQADVDARNPFNLYTPLHCAAACNNAEVITVMSMKLSFVRDDFLSIFT